MKREREERSSTCDLQYMQGLGCHAGTKRAWPPAKGMDPSASESVPVRHRCTESRGMERKVKD